jgi:hypothetical protein
MDQALSDAMTTMQDALAAGREPTKSDYQAVIAHCERVHGPSSATTRVVKRCQTIIKRTFKVERMMTRAKGIIDGKRPPARIILTKAGHVRMVF